MIGTRPFALAITLGAGIGLASPVAAIGDGGGLFSRKPKVDPARVRQLAEILRLESDEKKRRAAVMELAEADPRVHTEIIPALTGALRRDSAGAVRMSAAEVMGRYKTIFPSAGLALEDAMESDRVEAVRLAAREALWEYHLLGYRSARNAVGFTSQTPEPPFARPPWPARPFTSEPPTAAGVAAIPTPTIAPLPPVGPPPGPRVTPVATRPGTMLSAIHPLANLTVEPPIAKVTAAPAAVPVATTEPPLRLRWHEPLTVGKAPPLAQHLPSIVSDPGPIPGVTPFPTPTAEPPIRKLATVSIPSIPINVFPPAGK